MKPYVASLAGRTVYIRPVCSATPILRSLEELVGDDGGLFSYPNDVVVGPGSKWTHESLVTNRFSTFGKTMRDCRFGRTISATCVLMLPSAWWFDNRVVIGRCQYAQIGYKLGTDPAAKGVYAGLFLFTKKVVIPGSSSRRGFGENLLRYEFSCLDGEALVLP